MMSLGLILLAAFLLDAALGDPPWSFHPVRWMGALANRLERLLYRPGRAGLLPGFLLALLHPALVVSVYLLLRAGLGAFSWPWLPLALDVFALYSSFAFRDLFDHARPVLERLQQGELSAARDAVQRIIGRDANQLDASGVARAAVESVAESLGDGALGPLFWFTVGGLIAAGPLALPATTAAAAATLSALVFRAVNTLDSMVGSKSERYLYFGRASARLDDGLAFLPARCAVLFLALATALLRLDLRTGLSTWWRDRGLHPSPNAGQSESFVAGALGLRLGGPTIYPYGTIEKPWMGNGRSTATPDDLRSTCQLVGAAGGLAVASALALLTF